MPHKVILIKPSEPSDVRISKYLTCLQQKSIPYSFVGWNRSSKARISPDFDYVVKGWNSGYLKLVGYLLWYIKIIFYLAKVPTKNVVFYAADFESAMPCYLVGKFKTVKFIYDIYDDVSLRYNYFRFLKQFLAFLDNKVKNQSLKNIHVDENRISARDKNYVVIPNVPLDFYEGKYIQTVHRKIFAVTGWLTNTRGLNSIYCFAKTHPELSFIIYGIFDSSSSKETFSALPNVIVGDFIPQEQLFPKICCCSGIFALYDVSIEINVKAASNKIWDAMMLGIPVIVNKGMQVSDFVYNNDIGCVVNYSYDDSWSAITELTEEGKAKAKGIRARMLFEEHKDFMDHFDNKFVPILTQQKVAINADL